MPLRPRLGCELLLPLPLARLLAQSLVAAGEILLRPGLRCRAVSGRGLMRKIRVPQMRSRQCYEVGAPRVQDGVDLAWLGDGADRHRRHAWYIADGLGERHLEHTTIDRPLVGHRLARRDIDQIAAGIAKSLGDC